MSTGARVIVIEDQKGIRDGLCAYLSANSDFEIVGTASTVAEADELVTSSTFDAAIVDIELVQHSQYPHGFELAEAIRGSQPSAKVVLWSYYAAEGDLIRRAARPLGARLLADAIVSKNQPAIDLVRAIDLLIENPGVSFWIDPSLKIHNGSYSAVADLTPAEDRWVRVFAQRAGARPRDLQANLGISESTYQAQRRSLCTKVLRELDERGDPLMTELQQIAGKMKDPDLVKALKDEHLLRWARDRCLHWPITRPELQGREGKTRPNSEH